MTRLYSVSNGTNRRLFILSRDAQRRARQVAGISQTSATITVRIHGARTSLTRDALIERLQGKDCWLLDPKVPALDAGVVRTVLRGEQTGPLDFASSAATMLPLLIKEGFHP